MDIIITIADSDAKTILDQVAAAYSWTGLTPDECAARLSDEIKSDLVNRAVSGKNQLDRIALEAEVKAVTARALTVAMKVG
jgi:hypothetical protein